MVEDLFRHHRMPVRVGDASIFIDSEGLAVQCKFDSEGPFHPDVLVRVDVSLRSQIDPQRPIYTPLSGYGLDLRYRVPG
jgi:hypothetical protein